MPVVILVCCYIVVILFKGFLVLWQLKRSWSPHQSLHQPHFLNKWGEKKFEFEFCNNIEDNIQEVMPCITYSVVFHVYLSGSEILLTTNRHQVMVYFVLYLVRSCM